MAIEKRKARTSGKLFHFIVRLLNLRQKKIRGNGIYQAGHAARCCVFVRIMNVVRTLKKKSEAKKSLSVQLVVSQLGTRGCRGAAAAATSLTCSLAHPPAGSARAAGPAPGTSGEAHCHTAPVFINLCVHGITLGATERHKRVREPSPAVTTPRTAGDSVA